MAEAKKVALKPVLYFIGSALAGGLITAFVIIPLLNKQEEKAEETDKKA